MAIFQLQAKDSVVRIGGSSTSDCLNGIQSLSWDSAMNSENLEQIGDANYTGKTSQPSVSGSFEARATGSMASMLGRMIYTLNAATGEFEGYMGSSNGHMIRETDLQFACFDLIEAQKANEVFDRTTLIPRAYLSQLSLSANSDGTATESYNFEGDLLEVYRTPLHDLVSLAVIRNATTADSKVDVPVGYKVDTDGSDDEAEWTIHALDIDGIRIGTDKLTVTAGVDRGVDPDVVSLSGAAVTAGLSVTKGSKLALIIFRKTAGEFPTVVNPTQARFVKADQINIWLVDPTSTFTVSGTTATVENLLKAGKDLNAVNFADSDLVLRVQSCEISVPLQRQELKEIRKNDRGTSTYFRAAQYPLNMTASINATVTDLNDWAKIQGKDKLGADETPDILNLADFEGKTWMIVTRYYKGATVLQTAALLDAAVDGLGQQVSVGGKSERTWNFTGSKFALQGNAAA